MQTANHVLSKEGILTTFSIAKRITAKDIRKISQKLKRSKSHANSEELQDLLKEKIIKDTQKNLDINKIPGLIIQGADDEEEKKRIMELTYFASMIAKKLSEKNIDKYYSCYIINAIVNMLGLTEENFNEFHKKFSKFKNGDEKSTDGDNESSGLDEF